MLKDKNNLWAIIIGIGLALSPIHNKWLTDIATNSQGETLFFLPAFAYLLLIMGTGFFLLNNWQQVKETGWGDKKVIICLLVIIISISLSGLTFKSIQDKIAPLGMGIALFALYLASRLLGKRIFIPIAIGAAIASLGIIIYQLVSPGRATGGYIFEYNYDIATGYILLGIALHSNKWQWILILLGIVALILSGSAEALFAIGITTTFIVIHKRKALLNKKIILSVSLIGIILVAFFFTGYGYQVHKLSIWSLTGNVEHIPSGRRLEGGSPILRRINNIKQELADTRILGKGYNITNFSAVNMVHNVPLIMLQQLGYMGIPAIIAWLWVSIYCLVKVKWRWKYIWVLLFSLCVFDHYIWTQLAPLWWAMVGVSCIDENSSNWESTT